MLQVIREKTQTWVSWVLAVLLSLAFGLWGINYYLHGNTDEKVAVTVNGKTISEQQVKRGYEQLRDQQWLRAGKRFALSDEAKQQLENVALKSLVFDSLLQQTAEQGGLRVPIDQIDLAIVRNPAFQVNGKFSTDRFKAMVNANLITEQQYADQISRQLLINQIQVGFSSTAFVLPKEVADTMILLNQKRNIHYATLPFDNFLKNVSVTPAQIQAYYASHQQEFQSPEQVSIAYVKLSLKTILDNTQVSADEINQYYDEHADSFTDPRNGHKKPLAEVSANIKNLLAQEKAEQQFSAKISDLTNVSYANPDSLTEVTKQLELPVQTTELFARSSAPIALAKETNIVNAAFSDSVLQGNNSGVITSADGHDAYVIRINQHVAAQAKPLASVQANISQILLAQAEKSYGLELSKTITQQLNAGETLAAVAKQYHLVWQEQTNVSLHNTALPIAVLRAAFKAPPPNKTGAGWLAVSDLKSMIIMGVDRITYDAAPATTSADYKLFQEELENTYGQLDYQLFLRGLFDSAKITPEAQAATLKSDLDSSNS